MPATIADPRLPTPVLVTQRRALGPLLLPVLAVALAALGLGCRTSPETPGGTSAESPAAGVEIPRPSLEQIEEAARGQILAQIEVTETVSLDANASSGDLAEALGELGRLYHAYDFLEAAEGCYHQASKLDPNDVRWNYYLGFLLQTQGRFEEAAAALDRVLARRPDDLPALLRSADVDLALGRSERAAGRFRRALEVEPAAAKAHQGLGRLALEAGEAEAAIEHFETALRLQPQASALHYPLGRAYAATGQEQEARRHFEQRGNAEVTFSDPLVAAIDAAAQGASLRLTRAAVALAEGRTDAALAEYRQALEAEPGNLTARIDYGLLLAASGDLEQSERQLRTVLARDPDHPSAHDSLGRILEQRGADEEALAHFRQAVTIDPRFHTARLHLASTLLRLEKPSEADTEFSLVLEHDPGSVDALLGRARARLDAGQVTQALGDLHSLLSANPEHAVARLYLGEALQRGGDDAAVDEYLRAVESGLPPAQEALARLGAGNLLAAQRDWQRAAEQLAAAVELDAALHQAHFNLAGIYARLGRYELAVEHYTEVLKHRPGLLTARFYLAEANLRLGRYASAAEDFTAVLAVDPGHEGAHFGAAWALARQGRHRAARDRLEEGLQALPRSGLLAHALARLLAACPQRDLRDGPRALELALAVQSSQESLEHAETVAMALAEAGRFQEAATWQQAVAERAATEGRARLLERLRRNLALYEGGETCCSGDWWADGF